MVLQNAMEKEIRFLENFSEVYGGAMVLFCLDGVVLVYLCFLCSRNSPPLSCHSTKD